MNFKIIHCNINVQNHEKTVEFYKEALGLTVSREKSAADGSFVLTYMTDAAAAFEIELTWLRDHAEHPYNLGENESHICFRVDDYEAAHARHKEMGCIVYENLQMGLYFIADPDGYWLEIVPTR